MNYYIITEISDFIICYKFHFMVYLEAATKVFYKKDVFKNFAKFTCKHLCQSIFFSKVEGLRPATLLKKFCEFSKIFKNTYFTEHRRETTFAYSMVDLLTMYLRALRFQLKYVWGIPYQNAKNHKTLNRGYNPDNKSDLVTESIVNRLYV